MLSQQRAARGGETHAEPGRSSLQSVRCAAKSNAPHTSAMLPKPAERSCIANEGLTPAIAWFGEHFA